MPNRRGRPKETRPKRRQVSPTYAKLQQQKDREFLLISSELRRAGYFLWKPPGSTNWQITGGSSTYELFFQFESQSWEVLPVSRSLLRHQIVCLIYRALSNKEST